MGVRVGFPGWSDGKESACKETWVQSLDWENPLEEEMATHSSILAQRIPWTEEPVVYSPRSHKESDTGMLELVLLMRTNKAHLFARWAALYGVTPSRTRLK